MNICFSSAGRRVSLMEAFRTALRDLGVPGRVLAVDSSQIAPALYLADASWRVPPCQDPNFVPTLLRLCERERIELIIPTIDTELPVFARHREDFANVGVVVAISSPATIAIAADKVRTHAWLTSHGFPAPRQALARDALQHPQEWAYPLVVKPRAGSAANGFRVITEEEDLRLALRGRDDLIAQELLTGAEHTINVLVNRDGRCVCAVPHRRLEVRQGEVSKARTVKHPGLMELARAIAESLPGAFGALNIQCFISDAGARVIEINARFGGGFPLAWNAGADFPRWMLQELLGLPADAAFDAWQDNLFMLRYDEAAFVPGEALLALEGLYPASVPVLPRERVRE